MDGGFLCSSHQSKLCLFFAKLTVSPFSQLSLNILRELCLYLAPQCLLPWFDHQTITIHHLTAREKTFERLQFFFPRGSVFVLYQETMALCASSLRRTFEFDLCSLALCEVGLMLDPRVSPGIIAFNSSVYVFGGTDCGLLSTSERFDTQAKSWTSLPDMLTPKAGFTPIAFRGKIYLCFPNMKRHQFEVFDPVSEEFRLLPFTFESNKYASVAFTVDSSILIVTYEKKLVRLDVENCVMSETELSMRASDLVFVNIPPLKMEKAVYWVQYERGTIVKFDIDTARILEL